MTTSPSMFTEVIEDHLALKKQNAALEASMPLARFDVGDPLDRYPGGAVRPAVGAEDEQVTVAPEGAAAGTAMMAPADESTPAEPLNGMTPMLSLVEDLDEADDDVPAPTFAMAGAATAVMPAAGVDGAAAEGELVRFPGGAGPRESFADDAAATLDTEPTGEHPVIVIDADEPLAPATEGTSMPRSAERKRPTFFGLRRRKKSEDDVAGDGWFSQAPRDFDWD